MGKKYTTDEIEVGGHMLDASMMGSLNTVVTNSDNYLINNSSSDIHMSAGRYVTFYGNTGSSAVHHSIGGVDVNGNPSDDIRINSYHNVLINLDSNNNNTDTTTSFIIGQHGGTNTVSDQFFMVRSDGRVGINNISPSEALDVTGKIVASVDIKAPIFYDSDNTGYYVNPSSTSSMYRLELNNHIDMRAQTSTWIEADVMTDAIGWNTSYGVYIGSNIGGTHYLRGNGTFTTGGSTYNLYHTGNLNPSSYQPAGTYNTVIGTDSDINTSGAAVVDQLNMTDGVITSHSTRNLTAADIGASAVGHVHSYLPLSGGTLSGNLDVNADIQANTYTQAAHGIPRNNLGAPTVTEMALFDNQFTPKTTLANDYDDLSDLTFWKQETSSSAWVEITTFSDDQKRKFLRTKNSNIAIPNGVYKFRVEFVGKGYTFANAMYAYWSSQSHNTQVHVWKYNVNSSSWIQHTSSSATVASWPGHLYLPFSTIPWLESATTHTGHYKSLRIEFTPTWSTGAYSDRNINLYGMEIWGGYPSGRREPHYYDQDGQLNIVKNLSVAGDLKAPILYDYDNTSYYINPSGSTSAVLAGNVGIGTTSPGTFLQLGTYAVAGKYIDQATYPDVPSEHMMHITAPSTSAYYGGGISFGETTFTAANIVVRDAGGSGALDLCFGTGTNAGVTEKMRVASNGSVGIGTTTPSNKLNVNGDIGYTGVIGQGSIYGNTHNSSFSTMQLYNPSTGYTTLNNQSYGYYFNTSGGTKVTILNNGNVGIGTTSPRGKLDIVGNTDDDTDFLTIQDNDTSAGSHRPSIRFRSDTAQIGQIVSLNNSMRFSVGTTEDSLLEITSSGTVGVGTTSFFGKLSVNEAGSGVYFTRHSGDNGTTGPVLAFANDSTKSIIAAAGDGIIFRTRTVGGAAFSGSEKMRITSGGNVGIGSTAPQARLDVQPTASNRKVTRIANDVMSTYFYNTQADAVLAWTCGSYYQAEVVITANQTNGGTTNNLYIRGIWSNNHTSHHWDELEHIGGLQGSTITMSVGQNGATTNSGRLELDFNYISQSFAALNIRVTDFYGTHSYTIS